jgi:uncharacterized protein involved in response to NO
MLWVDRGGILIPAGANWTGINPLHGGAPGGARGLWLIARAAFLVEAAVAFWVAFAAEPGFSVQAALTMLRAVHASSTSAVNFPTEGRIVS